MKWKLTAFLPNVTSFSPCLEKKKTKKKPYNCTFGAFFGTIFVYISTAQCTSVIWSLTQKGWDRESKFVLKWGSKVFLLDSDSFLYGRSYKSFIFLLHQTPFQRLTLRMTRFYTSQPSAKVWNRLQHVMRNMGYDARTSADKVGIQTTMATIARFNHTYVGFMNIATWSSGNRYSQGSLITVVSRKYAPPFATLALVQNAGGLIRSMQHFLSQLRPPFRLSKAWPHCRWGVHPSTRRRDAPDASSRLWRASALSGEEAGHFHEVAGMSIVDAGSPCLW